MTLPKTLGAGETLELVQPIDVTGTVECAGPKNTDPAKLPRVSNVMRKKDIVGISINKGGKLILRNLILKQETWKQERAWLCNCGLGTFHPTARLLVENVWVEDGQGFRCIVAESVERYGGGTLPGTSTRNYDLIAGDSDSDMAEIAARKLKAPWRFVKLLKYADVKAKGGRGESALRLQGVIDARIDDVELTAGGAGKESFVARAFINLKWSGGSLANADIGPRGKSGYDIEWIARMCKGGVARAHFQNVNKTGYARACGNVDVLWDGGRTTARAPAGQQSGEAAFCTAGYRDRSRKWRQPAFFVRNEKVCPGYRPASAAVIRPGDARWNAAKVRQILEATE